MPSLVTMKSHSPADDRRGAVGRALVELPRDVAPRTLAVAAGLHGQQRLAHALRGIDHPVRGHRAGDRAIAHQAGQVPQAACRWPGRRRRAPVRPSRPSRVLVVLVARGSAWCTSRSFPRVAAVMRIVFHFSRPGPLVVGHDVAGRRLARQVAARVLHAHRNDQVADRARGCWRGPTRSCSRRGPSADCGCQSCLPSKS